MIYANVFVILGSIKSPSSDSCFFQGLDVPGWALLGIEDDVESFWTVSLNYHHFWIFRVMMQIFLCVVCWMSGFRDLDVVRCFCSVRVNIVNIWCGAEMTEKNMLPKRDWIGGTIRVPPLKGLIQQQGQVVFGQDVSTVSPCWRLGHVGNWPSICWRLPGKWRVKVGWHWVDELLSCYAVMFVETWKILFSRS